MNLPNRNASISIAICAISLCLSALLFASNSTATREKSPVDSVAARQLVPPIDAATPSPTPFCPSVITQSTSQDITTTFALCLRPVPTSEPGKETLPKPEQDDNHYWRAFNIPSFTGGAQYDVSSVSFGVESVNNTSQSVIVRLYLNNGEPFPGGKRTQIASGTIAVTPAQSGTVVTMPLPATV